MYMKVETKSCRRPCEEVICWSALAWFSSSPSLHAHTLKLRKYQRQPIPLSSDIRQTNGNFCSSFQYHRREPWQPAFALKCGKGKKNKSSEPCRLSDTVGNCGNTSASEYKLHAGAFTPQISQIKVYDETISMPDAETTRSNPLLKRRHRRNAAPTSQ